MRDPPQSMRAPNGVEIELYNTRIVGEVLEASVRPDSVDRTVTSSSWWAFDDLGPPSLDLRLLETIAGAPPLARMELIEDSFVRHVFDLEQGNAERIRLYTGDVIAVSAQSIQSNGGSGVFSFTRCPANETIDTGTSPHPCASCPGDLLCDPTAAALGTPECVPACQVDTDCASFSPNGCCNTFSNGTSACTIAYCPQP